MFDLLHYHLATHRDPLPPVQSGITWSVAANGTFKTAQNRALRATICVDAHPSPLPNLAALMTDIAWHAYPRRLPGAWLDLVLADAQRAATVTKGIAQPIEKQWFVIVRDQRLTLIPAQQTATATRIRYTMPTDAVLLDIHSHHAMPAYFSQTDDRDDDGLSVSCVIGSIFTTPTILCRINVYGHRQLIPATMLFADMPLAWRDDYGGRYAPASH